MIPLTSQVQPPKIQSPITPKVNSTIAPKGTGTTSGLSNPSYALARQARKLNINGPDS